MATARDPITTHVLDQTTGLPAGGVAVTLIASPSPNPSNDMSCHSADLGSGSSSGSSTGLRWRAQTSMTDGRISHWGPAIMPDGTQLSSLLTHDPSQRESSASSSLPSTAELATWRWELVFETGVYWQRKTDSSRTPPPASGSTSSQGAAQGATPTPASNQSFYPEIRIVFNVDPNDPHGHWHVPILMGPFGYTTYRGS